MMVQRERTERQEGKRREKDGWMTVWVSMRIDSRGIVQYSVQPGGGVR